MTTGEAERALQEARAELAAARELEEKALAAFEASKLDPKAEATREAHDRKLGAELLRGRAEAVVRLAEERLQESRAREAEAARVARYREAQSLKATAEKRLAEYPAAALIIQDILASVGAADAAIAAANADLPAGAVPLEHPEQLVRGLPGEAEVVLSKTVKPGRWVYVGPHDHLGDVAPELISKIEHTTRNGKSYGKDYGRIPMDRSRLEFAEVARTPDRVVTAYLPARPAYRPESLANTVALPGLLPGTADIWAPAGLSGWGGMPLGQDGPEVAAQAAALREAAAAPPSDPRPPRQQDTRVEVVKAAQLPAPADAESAA
ncbi:hypothetical protein [Methylobacterium isbiliense]|uniref:Uncharacterized protein n=1 Tax=Methylobacterium isbiliense TaxID=315478 RepID=A0ABQ4SC46_9HYPH|nr:hypothetical protein [Methylobacterium isbiliense]MDN3625589.1 hypothetical protein [Methylobacterium isbiliense]GJE00025.1 hypothetical protein GMJLKIPL_1943 [Methylobacterium isbiliense]